MALDQDLPPVPYNAPVIDQNGLLTSAWQGWFKRLFIRVGAHVAKTNVQLDLTHTGSITTDLLEDGSVTNPKLGAGSVSASKMAANSISTTALEDVSVTTGKLVDSAVTTQKIGDLQVTTPKIALGAVGTSQLADGSVGTAELADGSVTDAKVAAATLTLDKVSTAGATLGQVPRYNGIGISWDTPAVAAGGSLVADGIGGNQLNISPTVSTLVLVDSGTAKWDVTVNTDGTLTTKSGSSGTATTAFKIQKPDTTYGQLGINTDGTLYVDNSPTASAVNNHFYLEDSSLVLWQIAIDNNNEIQTIQDVGSGANLSVVDAAGKVLWQLRCVAGYIPLQYLRVLSTADLTIATPPTTVTGLLPLAMLDNGTAKRLIFHDGSAWKYVHDNSGAP